MHVFSLLACSPSENGLLRARSSSIHAHRLCSSLPSAAPCATTNNLQNAVCRFRRSAPQAIGWVPSTVAGPCPPFDAAQTWETRCEYADIIAQHACRPTAYSISARGPRSRRSGWVDGIETGRAIG